MAGLRYFMKGLACCEVMLVLHARKFILVQSSLILLLIVFLLFLYAHFRVQDKEGEHNRTTTFHKTDRESKYLYIFTIANGFKAETTTN
jgi:Ca2+/Na+ antiporter